MTFMRKQGFKNYEKLQHGLKDKSEFQKLRNFYEENIRQTRTISKIIAYIWYMINDDNDEIYDKNKGQKLYIQATQWLLDPTSDEDEKNNKDNEDDKDKNSLKLPSLAKLMYAPLPNDKKYQEEKYNFFRTDTGKRYSEFLEQVVLSCMTEEKREKYQKIQKGDNIKEGISIQDLLGEMNLKIPIFPFDTGHEWLFETNVDTFDGYLKDPDLNHPNIYTVVIAFPPRPHFCITEVGRKRLTEWLGNDGFNVSHHPYIPNCSC